MKEFIIRYWLEVAFGAVVAIATYQYKNFAKKCKSQEALKLGVQALLRNDIVDTYNYWVDRGYFPIYARDALNAMYAPYHGLGANGVVDELIDTLKELPSEKKVII